MTPYAKLAVGISTSTSSALAARLASWHDAMVVHERRLRTGRTGDVCDDECPHGEARTLWAEALEAFGDRAHELSFLRSRATTPAPPVANAVDTQSRESGRVDNDRSADGEWKRSSREPRHRSVPSSAIGSQRMMTEAEL